MDKEVIKKLQALPLRAIGERYGFRFERVGDKLRALCHFHNDTGTPNLFVYPDDSFFCFACRRGGGKAAFIAYAEHVDRKAIEKIWNDATPPDELILTNLQPREADYKPQLLLYLSKFFYELRKRNPKAPLACMQDFDTRVSRRPFIHLAEYSAIVDDLKRKLGGTNG